MRASMGISAFILLLSLATIFNTTLGANLSSLSPVASAGDPLGETFLLGTTWHDYQSNGTVGRMISRTAIGDLHFCWMNGLDSLAVNRHIFYNWFIHGSGVVYPGLGYQIDQGFRGGYSAASNLSTGEAILGYHKKDGQDDEWQIEIMFGYVEGFGFLWTDIENPSWGIMSWPKVAVCLQDFVHILAYENNEFWGRLAYSKSEDGGARFSDWILIDTLIAISQDVAASPVSNKVGIVYTKPCDNPTGPAPLWYTPYLELNNNIILIESEDGTNWNFLERVNVTNLIPPDTSRWPDSTWANGDTLRAHCDVSLLYDRDDHAHVAFTVRGFWPDADWIIEEDPYPIPRITRDASMIWHWSEAHDTLTRVADGWYDIGRSDDDVNLHRGSGGWRSTVDRPCLAQDPETGYLYCIYVRCTPGDTSGGPTPSHGWANGEIYCSVSTDGGLNWSEGTNLTNTPSSGCTPGNCFDEDYPSQTLVVNDTLHIIYIEDKDAGGVVMTAPQEGIWTENPVIYQKVPADLIPPGPPYVSNFYFHVGPVGATKVEQPLRTSGVVPEHFVLHQNHPNPFNADTEIRYQIPEAAHVTLKIFNTLGQEVRSLVDGEQGAGEHRVRWDGCDAGGHEAASGLYFCRLRVGEVGKTVKMVLMR